MCSYDPNNTSELWILTNLASALIMLVNEGCVETRSCFSALIRIINGDWTANENLRRVCSENKRGRVFYDNVSLLNV